MRSLEVMLGSSEVIVRSLEVMMGSLEVMVGSWEVMVRSWEVLQGFKANTVFYSVKFDKSHGRTYVRTDGQGWF